MSNQLCEGVAPANTPGARPSPSALLEAMVRFVHEHVAFPPGMVMIPFQEEGEFVDEEAVELLSGNEVLSETGDESVKRG